MVPTVLTLQTAEGLHELACPPGACMEVGADADCEIALDGAGILPRHCTLTRTGERRFRIKRLDDAAKFTVNGVEAPELEVEVPFRFGIGGETITLDLAMEDEAAVPAEVGAEASAAVRISRRGYLLQPPAVRLRAPGGIGEVRLQQNPGRQAPETPAPVPAPFDPPSDAVEAEEKAESGTDGPSSRVLFAGLVFCVVMIGGILCWQHFLDRLQEPEKVKPPRAVVEIEREHADEDYLGVGVSLRRAGLSRHAAMLLLPLAESKNAEVSRELALAQMESGDFSGDPAGVLRRLAENGSRSASADLVVVVDSPLNPERHAAEVCDHLEFATRLGEPTAWMPLGVRLEQGLGVGKDLQAALACYKKAREAGDARAAAKLAAEHDAMDCVAAFIRSWNEVSVAVVLDHVAAAPRRYFALEQPAMEAVLRVEERLRALWPLRRISVTEGAACTLRSFEELRVTQPFLFEVQRGQRIARGTGLLTCDVRLGAGGWRIVSVTDKIEIKDLLPAADQFATSPSLRLLTPAFTVEEQVEETRLEIMDRLRGLEETQDFKPTLTLILNAAMAFPQEKFWRPFADRLCDRMAREFFSQGQWLDAAWAAPVHQLAEMGSVSAMLLEGHLLMAGYGYSRDERRGAALYQKAFESGKRGDARFYYAEALFQGRGVVQDFDKAGALVLVLMSRSKHPLEAYLAAHLLWRKAEVDPSLWQDVYDTLSRVADQHPPAKHLAAMVLLNHGNTTRERKTGFSALQAAAEAGVPEAMKSLAKCYQDGIGCEKDLQAAALWKQKAAITEPPRRRHYTEFEE